MGTNIDKYVELSEIPATQAIPIGGIIAWWPQSAGSPEPTPPTNFEYCDGTAVSTSGSPLLGLNKPELMKTVAASGATQRVIRGADTNSTYGGATAFVTGGADTHTHTGTTDLDGAHTHTLSAHTHSMQSHTHSLTNDGAHTHDLGGGGGSIEGAGGFFTTSAGGHNHGGVTGTPNTANTGAPSSDTTNSAGTHTHSFTSAASSSLPAYVEIAWIVRVL